MTLFELEKFLDEHRNPDVVIVHPQDFVAITSFASAKVEANTCWLYGTKYIRGESTEKELDWSARRIPSND